MECPKRNVLVLDRDYRPHRIIGWKRAMKHMYSGKVEVICDYGDAQTPYEPAVIRLIHRAIPPGKIKHRVKFMPRYMYMRDGYRCQYCFSDVRKNLTIDHVLPRCKGGPTTYDNCTTACFDCNQKKANKTLEEAGMKLLSIPVTPFLGMVIPNHKMPQEWTDYIMSKVKA